jgi:hypothetical protein
MSTVLPVDTPPEPRKQPWLLNVLEVNTMNFCSFAQSEVPSSGNDSSQELLIAVPNTMGSETVCSLPMLLPPAHDPVRLTSFTSLPREESTPFQLTRTSKAAW